MAAQLDVQIQKLDAMRVVCFNGYGANPEHLAWEKLIAFMDKNHMAFEGRRVFGYNNPEPAPGSPNYGYDVWLTLKEEIKPDEGGSVIDFPGGSYAVTHVKSVEDIFPTWQKFIAWLESSPYQLGSHQYLEEHLNPARVIDANSLQLDLYLPIQD